MDPRLLDYYNRELGYFRELGAEFADQFPKVASRLGIKGIQVPDPHVERFLEGAAFLAARVQLKMDAEFPRFSQRLMEVVYPNYVAPTPAAAIVRFAPKLSEATLSAGFPIPRGTPLRAQIPHGEQTACEFQTAHAVTLWPLELVDATLTGAPPDLSINRLDVERPIRGAIRLRFRTAGDIPVKRLAIPRLSLYLAGTDDQASRIYELLVAGVCGVLVCGGDRSGSWQRFLQPSCVQPEGFADAEAMFPYAARGFDGYRLLHEYFAFPQRYQFISIGERESPTRSEDNSLSPLAAALKHASGNSFDIVLLLDRAAPDLERVIDVKQFALYCTPAVNLFQRRSDRIPLTPDVFEHHVVIDHGRPVDFEVYAIQEVLGHSPEQTDAQTFRPFYGSVTDDDRSWGRYYSLRREPRLLSDKARGHQTGYIGSEVFLSLVDQAEAPYRGDLRQLTVVALCTNRDLPVLMPRAGKNHFTLLASAPVESVNVLHGPSRPYPSLAEGAMTWRLISHLALNYLTLTELDKQHGAVSLRRLLELYSVLADPVTKRQVDGVQGIATRPVTRRMPRPGPLVFGRGVEITVTIDETSFAGAFGLLLGHVLAHFFARHVGLNTFTETVLESLQRGHLARWAPRSGTRPLL